MNVTENIQFGLKATGRKRGAAEAAEALLADVGLEGYGRHKVYELSGGMQHRVSIARTLALNPDVLLMDEPFGALDAQTRADMQVFLLDLWQRHRSTVVFVTHDIEEGLLLSDRVVVLGKGTEGVRAIVDVDIPRPRTYGTALTKEFIELRKELKSLITQPAVDPREMEAR
jgi:ABC-type nitrate/sulfonate/bicarbonate transport system ATPase subunit